MALKLEEQFPDIHDFSLNIHDQCLLFGQQCTTKIKFRNYFQFFLEPDNLQRFCKKPACSQPRNSRSSFRTYMIFLLFLATNACFLDNSVRLKQNFETIFNYCQNRMICKGFAKNRMFVVPKLQEQFPDKHDFSLTFGDRCLLFGQQRPTKIEF